MQTTVQTNQVPAVLVPAKSDPIAYLLTRKGQIVTLRIRRAMKTRKAVADTCEKESVFQARVGSDYDNSEHVQAKRASGELPAVNDGLPWGVWEIKNYVIAHHGKRYFRFQVVHNNFTPRVTYYLNGYAAALETVQPLCLASEFAEKTGECFNVSIESIREVL